MIAAMSATTSYLAADPVPTYTTSATWLIIGVLAGIAAIVLLISVWKVHPFLALILGSFVLGAIVLATGTGVVSDPATQRPAAPLDVVALFVKGFGNTTGSVGLLVALGAMVGKLLADSGGADRIVNRFTDSLSPKWLPWGMALIAAIIGLPLFFEVGVVILVPVVVMVARRTGMSLMKLGIPALAGLSVLHGLVPPHPGPQTAIGLLKANQGQTLIFGILVAIPTLIIAGPLLARLVDKWVPVHAPPLGASSGHAASEFGGGGVATEDEARQRRERAGAIRMPSFMAALISMILPVLLMLCKAIADLVIEAKDNPLRQALDFIGEPSVALLITVLFAFFALGKASGMSNKQANDVFGSALPGIASILLIVAAGGGFKQVLSEVGVANVIKEWATGANISVLVLGWLVAVAVRLATGSATVATITSAGIVGELAGTLSPAHLALLVLAIGCGSLFFSHVNDAGFWLVKEYFGLTVGQTIKSWSIMETVISVVGFGFVMLLSVIVS